MADVWLNALQIVMRSMWTPEYKQEVGEAVLNALLSKRFENENLPKIDMDAMTSQEFFDYLALPNSHHNTTITVNTN